MLLDSQDVFLLLLFFSKLDNISSPIVSQSHIHYVRRMSLNSNQGKIIPSVVFFLKNFKICTFEIAFACAQLVTVQSSDWPIAVI